MCFCFGKVLLVSQNWSSTCLKWEHDWDEDADALTGQGDGNRPCADADERDANTNAGCARSKDTSWMRCKKKTDSVK